MCLPVQSGASGVYHKRMKSRSRIYLHFFQSPTGISVKQTECVQWWPHSTGQSQEEVSWRSRLSLSRVSPFSVARMFQVQLQLRPSCVLLLPVWVFSRCPGFLPHSKTMNIKLIGDFWLLLSVSDPRCIGSGCWNSTLLVSWLRNKSDENRTDGIKPKRSERKHEFTAAY